MHNVELLAPARDLEELKVNINNGANAVYIGGEVFGIKSQNKDFSNAEMIEGIEFALSCILSNILFIGFPPKLFHNVFFETLSTFRCIYI